MSIRDGELHIELDVRERVLSLQARSVRVPLRQIRSATSVSDVMSQLRGLRMPGAGVPGLLAIGTWHGATALGTFHDLVVVQRPGPGVVLMLRRGEYDRILLGTPHPDQLVADIESA